MLLDNFRCYSDCRVSYYIPQTSTEKSCNVIKAPIYIVDTAPERFFNKSAAINNYYVTVQHFLDVR